MTSIHRKLESWPRTKGGDIILKHTEEAYFFAILMFDKPDWVKEIKKLRMEVFAQVGALRKKKNPNLNEILQLGFKSQFYRECLEEVDRLKNQTYQLNQGGK